MLDLIRLRKYGKMEMSKLVGASYKSSYILYALNPTINMN